MKQGFYIKFNKYLKCEWLSVILATMAYWLYCCIINNYFWCSFLDFKIKITFCYFFFWFTFLGVLVYNFS